MCTLIIGFHHHRSVIPLWVAANRDELRTRPASAPRWWPGENFFAPRDEQAGGTWLGLTRSQMFVGVTNRFGGVRDPSLRSRGELVLEALRAPDAATLHAQLRANDLMRFNTFHLLYADARDAFVSWFDGAEVHHRRLSPGLHVVTERSLGADDEGRTALIERMLPTLPLTSEGAPAPTALQQLLGTADPEHPERGVCVDLPQWNYGTRSALVTFVRPQLADSQWWWAEGRPDQVPFVEQSSLLHAVP